MKSQYVVWGLAASIAAIAVAIAAPVVAAGVLGVAGLGLGIYLIGRCRHPGPLGLLPPTVAADGTRTPAQWYCDACGRSWPAGLESDRSPVVRFTGYDESKLPASAERAAALDRQRHALAVKRAGLSSPHTEPALGPTNVTSIKGRRAG
jgi:hypothetical protein